MEKALGGGFGREQAGAFVLGPMACTCCGRQSSCAELALAPESQSGPQGPASRLPRAPLTLPGAQDPISLSPGAISRCPSGAAAVPVSGCPQPCPMSWPGLSPSPGRCLMPRAVAASLLPPGCLLLAGAVGRTPAARPGSSKQYHNQQYPKRRLLPAARQATKASWHHFS